jgi:exosortase A-associated hydrolase 2
LREHRVNTPSSHTAYPFFLPGRSGELFAIFHPPACRTAENLTLLFIHPFGEELNHSRRMVAFQSRELSRLGIGVLRVDLSGCGDSGGDLASARWGAWLEDLETALDWLHDQMCTRVGLWGLRLGCLLATELVNRTSVHAGVMILWQPVLSGEDVMEEFLGRPLGAGPVPPDRARSAALRKAARAAGRVEANGYTIAAHLIGDIDRARLTPPAPANVGVIHWFEMQPVECPAITAAGRGVIDDWGKRGLNVRPCPVAADAFWRLDEATVARRLLRATSRLFGDAPE